MIESQHKKIKQRNKFIIIALINSKGENTQKRLTDITIIGTPIFLGHHFREALSSSFLF